MWRDLPAWQLSKWLFLCGAVYICPCVKDIISEIMQGVKKSPAIEIA
jgi:hypothetical protein